MSHSSTSGILKALAELGEGVRCWLMALLAAASRNAAIGSRLFSFFLRSLIPLSFGPSCWETVGRMAPRVADDEDLACRLVLRRPRWASDSGAGSDSCKTHTRDAVVLGCSSQQTVCWQTGSHWAQRRPLCIKIATKTDDAAFSSCLLACLPGKTLSTWRLPTLAQPSAGASESNDRMAQRQSTSALMCIQ